MEDVSVIKKAAEMNAEHLLTHFDRIADAPDAIPRLRRFILNLAVHGKVASQYPTYEFVATRYAGEPISDELPANWRLLNFGKYCDIEGGNQPPKSQFINEPRDGYIQLLQIRDLGERPVPTYIPNGSTNRFCKEGEILIGRYGASIGKIFWAKNGAYNVAIAKFIWPEDAFIPTFAFLILKSKHFQDPLTKATRSAQAGFNKRDLATINFPLPPLAEQHRIVAKVDELMALCDRLEAARVEREATRDRMATASLAHLNAPDPDPATFQNHAAFALNNLTPLTTRHDQIKALRQTILNLAVRGKLVPQNPNDEPASELLKRIAMERNDLVEQKIIRRDTPLAAIDESEPPFEVPNGWEWSRIGDAVLFTQYGTSTKSSPSAPGVPVLTMGNIHAGMVVWGNEKTIPYTAEEFPALYLKQFDLLYNRTNSAELVGKTGIYLGEDDCRTFASYLIRLRASREHFSPNFLNLAMNTPEFRETQIIPLIKKQTGQANVNGTALKHMLVPVPPLAEQHRIVAKVDDLMDLCDRLETSLTMGDETRGRLVEALLHETLAPGIPVQARG